MKRLYAAIAAMGLAAMTFVAPAFAGTTAPKDAGTVVSVDLWDAGPDLTMVSNMRIKDHPDLSKAPMGIKISQATVPAGHVTFKVVNSSKDFVHEMVVAILKDPQKGLVYDENTGGVNEDAPGMHLGEVPERDPGQSGSLTLNLKPGKYALYCNVAGHYASGMWTILTVK